MIKFFTYTILIVLSIGKLTAQPTIEWQKSFGGSVQDLAEAVKPTNDGGYILVGTTYSSNVPGFIGGADIWVIKFSASGEEEWQNCYGGPYSDEASDIEQTADGGYIIVGLSNGGGYEVEEHIGMDDFFILKLDSSGEVEWQKIAGGTLHDRLFSIKQTADGGYIAAGSSSGALGPSSWDYLVMKLDESGNTEWETALGGTRSDEARCIEITADGGYVVAGSSYSNDGDITHHMSTANSPDYWIVKLDSEGEIEWEKALGGSSSDNAYSIQHTTDGGYIVAGETFSQDGHVTNHHNPAYRDIWMVKLNESGEIEWEKCLGGTSSELVRSVRQTQDGGYVVAGATQSIDGDVTYHPNSQDAWIIKLNEDGDIQWEKTFGGSGIERATCIIQSSDGGFVFSAVADSNDGDLEVNYGIEDFWIVKISGTTSHISETKTSDRISIYPNPGRERLTIETKETFGKFTTVSICDMQGRIILNQQIKNGNRCEVNTAQIAAGVYHVQVKNVESITSNVWIKE